MTPLHVAAVYAFVGAIFSLGCWSISGHRAPMTPLAHLLTGFHFALLWPYYAARLAIRVARRARRLP